jgi:undecaprenyl-diphosphatase
MMSMDLTDPYVKFYLLFIQFGALCAGVVLFSKRILTDRQMLYSVSVSFLPTAVFGFIFYKMFKHLLDGNVLLMAFVLAAGGVVFIWLEKVYLQRDSVRAMQKSTISLKDAALIGCAQSLAIIPGVSRSGSTIVAGLLLGIKKAVIVEYTFLLALPTLGAAVLCFFDPE